MPHKEHEVLLTLTPTSEAEVDSTEFVVLMPILKYPHA
jgi:hypothetical protein